VQKLIPPLSPSILLQQYSSDAIYCGLCHAAIAPSNAEILGKSLTPLKELPKLADFWAYLGNFGSIKLPISRAAYQKVQVSVLLLWRVHCLSFTVLQLPKSMITS